MGGPKPEPPGLKRRGRKEAMLYFLKEILGEVYTEDIDKKISEAVSKDFVTRSEFNVKNEAVKELEKQLNEASKTIDSFKEMDIDGIKKKAEEYKEQAEKARAEAEQTIQSIQYDIALEKALTAANVRDTKSVCAHIDRDSLVFKDGELIGLDKQIEEIKGQHDYLFNPDPNAVKPPAFSDPIKGEPVKLSREDFKKMTYAEKLKIKTEQPELYSQIIKN